MALLEKQRGAGGASNSLAEQFARTIEREIEAGTLERNALIGTKDQLQRRFNVARGTLNEAIQLLRSRDLVRMRPGPKGGIFVAQPSPVARFSGLVLALRDNSNLATECYSVKDALDPWIAADAAVHRSSTDVRSLRAIARRMKRAVPDKAMFGACNWELHRRIAMACANVVMRTLYVSVIDVIQAEVTGSDVSTDFNLARYGVHQQLVDAIAAGDEALAFRLGGDGHRMPMKRARPAEPG